MSLSLQILSCFNYIIWHFEIRLLSYVGQMFYLRLLKFENLRTWEIEIENVDFCWVNWESWEWEFKHLEQSWVEQFEKSLS